MEGAVLGAAKAEEPLNASLRGVLRDASKVDVAVTSVDATATAASAPASPMRGVTMSHTLPTAEYGDAPRAPRERLGRML